MIRAIPRRRLGALDERGEFWLDEVGLAARTIWVLGVKYHGGAN
jgi:hypothetical protein